MNHVRNYLLCLLSILTFAAPNVQACHARVEVRPAICHHLDSKQHFNSGKSETPSGENSECIAEMVEEDGKVSHSHPLPILSPFVSIDPSETFSEFYFEHSFHVFQINEYRSGIYTSRSGRGPPQA